MSAGLIPAEMADILETPLPDAASIRKRTKRITGARDLTAEDYREMLVQNKRRKEELEQQKQKRIEERERKKQEKDKKKEESVKRKETKQQVKGTKQQVKGKRNKDKLKDVQVIRVLLLMTTVSFALEHLLLTTLSLVLVTLVALVANLNYLLGSDLRVMERMMEVFALYVAETNPKALAQK